MKKYVVVKSLQIRYIFGLGTLALLTTISYFTMQSIVSQQRNFSQLVNLASHQSGLVNRIAYFSGLMATTDDLNEFNMAKSQVGRTVNKIKKNQHILRYGSAKEGIPFITNKRLTTICEDPEFGLNFSLKRFLGHAQGIYKSDINELTTNSIDYIYLTAYGPHILEPMIEGAVEEYKNIAKASILKIERFEFIIWLISLFVLILEAILIFNPLVKKVKKSINSLEISVAEHEVSEVRLLEAQQLASIGDWQLNLIDNTLIWADEIYRIFGISPDTFFPSIEAVLQKVHPDDRQDVQVMLEKTILNCNSANLEHRIIRPDGSERVVYIQAIAHKTEDGRIISLMGTIQDITEQNKAQKELELYKNELEDLVEERTLAMRTACKEAEQANKAKSQFLSSMSHELRTPLNAIIGFSEMLEEYGDSASAEEKLDYVSHIIKAGYHLLNLINEVLDLSRIDAGYLDINLESIPLNLTIKDTISQIEVGLANRSNISMNNMIEDQEITIMADPVKFTQVMINLLNNAVKYNQKGGTVTVKTEQVDKDNLRIFVSDTGNGIEATDIDKVFEPFERLSYKNSNVEGTGIGMTVTKQLVEAMGGTIGVESIVNQGTTFWLEMPRGTEINLPAKVEKDVLPKINKSSAFKYSILYIEDNPINAHLVMEALKKRGGYEVIISTSAEQGLTVAEEEIPDLILMDLTLPGIDGIAAFNILRNMKPTSKIPILAVTANAMTDNIQTGLDVGFEEYIAKPINVQNLYLAIEKHLPKY